MNVVEVTKMVSTLAVSTGVASIVTSAAKLVVPAAKAGKLHRMASKVSVTVGAAVLSSMVADQAIKYTEEKIDKAAEAIKQVSDVVEAAVSETS